MKKQNIITLLIIACIAVLMVTILGICTYQLVISDDMIIKSICCVVSHIIIVIITIAFVVICNWEK